MDPRVVFAGAILLFTVLGHRKSMASLANTCSEGLLEWGIPKSSMRTTFGPQPGLARLPSCQLLYRKPQRGRVLVVLEVTGNLLCNAAAFIQSGVPFRISES